MIVLLLFFSKIGWLHVQKTSSPLFFTLTYFSKIISKYKQTYSAHHEQTSTKKNNIVTENCAFSMVGEH